MLSSLRRPRPFCSYLQPHTRPKNLELPPFSFIPIITLSLLCSLPVQAGAGGSKPAVEIIEDEVRKYVVGLQPIVQEEHVIKTKSQKPTRPRPQNATIIEAPASPLREQEEMVLKKIVPGEDGRVRVDQTDSWPHSAHGVVYMRFPSMPHDSYCWGTGALISPTVVLTCAHNLYSHQYREPVSTVRFLPAINSKALPFGEAGVKEWYYPPAYQETKREDYGVLILDRPLGEETGYLGLSVLPHQQLRALRLSITGYPGDKVAEKDRQYEMWGMEGPVRNLDPEHISYEMDTYAGQSGSPVCYKDGDEYRVVGIHVLEDRALGVNKATFLTKARYDQIDKWVMESLHKRLKEIAIEGAKKIDLPYSSLGKNEALGEVGMKALVQYHLPNLTHLTIWGNSIGGGGAAHLLRLQNLIFLHIADNNIGDVGAAHVAKLHNLIELDIGKNNIGDGGAAHVAKLHNLTKLDIADNNIGDEGAAHLAKLQKLTSLRIEDNKVGKAGATHLAKLQNLTSLRIEDNKIKKEGAAHLANLPNLASLRIGSNEIGEAGAAHLARLQSLTSLYIGGNLQIWPNKIGDAGAAYLARLQNLIELDIGRNNIGDAGAAHLVRLPNLTSLHIYDNNMGDAGAAHVARLRGLTFLDIRWNDISKEGAAQVATLPNLTSLYIASDKIGSAGKRSLQSARFVESPDWVWRRHEPHVTVWIADFL